MAHGEPDAMLDNDPHALLFGSDDEANGEAPAYDGVAGNPGETYPMSRTEARRADREQRRNQRRRRGRRGLVAACVVTALAVVAVAWFVVKPIYDARYHPKDYSGSGTGSVQVKVNSGDDAGAIASTLVHAHVVASSRAFTNAAGDNSNSENIEPGVYQLRLHMKASSALALLLTPSARISAKVLVPEGATTLQVEATLVSALHVSLDLVKAAITNLGPLGLPTSYTVNGAAPSSVEGFLYPATYQFDPGTSPSDALSQMVATFIDQDRASGFAGAVKALKINPYQALTIASIAQSEAIYPTDMAKVARVILNRLAADMPLQIDATSAYGAKLLGLDPTKVNYASLSSPYNSYLHPGLPPTPISNPGAEALSAAAKPTAGNWLYYVNADAAGHLFFTNNMAAFTAAQEKCYQHNWGCAAP